MLWKKHDSTPLLQWDAQALMCPDAYPVSIVRVVGVCWPQEIKFDIILLSGKNSGLKVETCNAAVHQYVFSVVLS